MLALFSPGYHPDGDSGDCNRGEASTAAHLSISGRALEHAGPDMGTQKLARGMRCVKTFLQEEEDSKHARSREERIIVAIGVV